MSRSAPRQAVWAAALGWGLDSFDFWLYVYALPSILVTFGLSKSAGGLLATYTLVASAAGGIAMGTLADRIGRKNALMISIAWYSFFTFVSGFAQNYAQLAVARALQGFGFGAEWAVGAVFIAEWAAAHRRGRTLGLVQSAWAIGWLAATLAFQIVFTFAPSNPGWRYLFFIGILPAFVLLYIRGQTEDAPRFRSQKSLTLGKIFRGPLLRTTVLLTVLSSGAQSGYYALFTWLPTYLATQRHLAAVTSGAYVYLVIAGAFAGYLISGFFNDRWGRRQTFAFFAICSAIMVPLYLYFVSSNEQLLIAGAPLGFFASGIFSGFGPYLSELYPDAARGAGQGFCYNVGRGVAGFAPWAIGALAARLPIGTAMALIAAAAYGVVIATLGFLPETRGAALSQEIPGKQS